MGEALPRNNGAALFTRWGHRQERKYDAQARCQSPLQQLLCVKEGFFFYMINAEVLNLANQKNGNIIVFFFKAKGRNNITEQERGWIISCGQKQNMNQKSVGKTELVLSKGDRLELKAEIYLYTSVSCDLRQNIES